MIHYRRWQGLALTVMTFFSAVVSGLNVIAATRHVAQSDPKAADTNAGTMAAPWKTILAGRTREARMARASSCRGHRRNKSTRRPPGGPSCGQPARNQDE